jgi:hypothetical protein
MNPGQLPAGVTNSDIVAYLQIVLDKQNEVLLRTINMDALSLSQIVSFLIGALCAMAFVMASRRSI